MTGFRSASLINEIGIRLLLIVSVVGLVGLLGSHMGVMQKICEWNAQGAVTLMRWTGLDALSSGNLIAFNNGNLRVDSECSAVLTVGALVVLMSVVPVSLFRISSGIFVGTLLILFGNVLRIAFLGHLAVSFPAALGVWHLFLLPALQLLLTFGIWWIWFERTIRDNPKFAHHSGDLSILGETSIRA